MKFIDAASDPWHAVTADDAPVAVPEPQPHALLTPAQWQAVRSSWPEGLPAGLMLANDVDVETVADWVGQFAVIALHFPAWTDGRAYSQAHLLRARYAFRGELRATGAVLVDMVPLLSRCGFDAAQLREGQSQAAAERALTFFGDGHYQGDVDEPLPRFARGEVGA